MKPQAFETGLIDFMTQICRKDNIETVITPETRLFEDRLINSMRIIDLMAFVEKKLEMTIPDDKLTMKYFRTPRAITDTFCQGVSL